MVTISCFGPPTVTRAGSLVRLARTRSLALLVYLAVTGRAHSRESLATLLWPECETGRSLTYLRSALFDINEACTHELLFADRQKVALDLSHAEVDVRRFGDLATRRGDLACLEQAAALYGDVFLRGFTIAGAPEFEEWQRHTAESLSETHREVVRRLVESHARVGDLQRAIACAQVLVEADAIEEESHLLLMRLLGAAGRSSAVEVAFQRLVRTLEAELGEEPGEAARRLHALAHTGDDESVRKECLHQVLGGTAPGAASPRAEARIRTAASVTVARDGRIFAVDLAHRRVIAMDDMNGRGLTAFGTHGRGPGQFEEPWTVRLDARGRIYVADHGLDRIVRVDAMDGTGWTTLGRGGDGPTSFHGPMGMALDSLGRILVADHGNHRIVRVNDMSGHGWVSLGGFKEPSSIAVDDSGWIYVVDFADKSITRLDDMDGSGRTRMVLAGLATGLQQVSAVCTAPEPGVLHAVTHGPVCSAFRIVGMSGLEWDFYDGTSRPRGEAPWSRGLAYPMDVAVDVKGRIYIADQANHRIVRMDDISGAGWVEFPRPAYASAP